MKIFLELIVVLLSIGLPLYLMRDGFKKNILAIFFLLIYGSYVVWPLILIHEFSLNHMLNIQVDEYIVRAFLLDSLFLIFFAFGYFLFLRKNKDMQADTKEISPHIVIFLYWTFFSLIFLNNFLSDIDLLGKWLGNSNQMTYGVKGISYWLQNLLDSLIVITLLAYAININRMHFCVMLMGCIFFIVPFGFRYRLIFLLLGFLLIFIPKFEFNIKRFISMTIGVGLIFCTFLFVTLNRDIIVGYSPGEKFRYKPINDSHLISQIRGAYVDVAIYQGIDNSIIVHDRGKSFFYYTLIRAMPASYFDNGVKPYPPILMQDVDRVLNLSSPVDCQGCRWGEAQTIMGSIYYSFGSWGIGIIATILGFLIRFHSSQVGNSVARMWGICTLLATFTFITRGYFPQVIDNWVYLVLPLMLVKIWIYIRPSFYENH